MVGYILGSCGRGCQYQELVVNNDMDNRVGLSGLRCWSINEEATTVGPQSLSEVGRKVQDELRKAFHAMGNSEEFIEHNRAFDSSDHQVARRPAFLSIEDNGGAYRVALLQSEVPHAWDAFGEGHSSRRLYLNTRRVFQGCCLDGRVFCE